MIQITIYVISLFIFEFVIYKNKHILLWSGTSKKYKTKNKIIFMLLMSDLET